MNDEQPEPGALNRQPGVTAASANLDGAPHGLKVTGDAAWDSDSLDYAMHTTAGNLRVAAMVVAARNWIRRGIPEDGVLLIIEERARLIGEDHPEVLDAAVQRAVSRDLGEAWQAAYGHRHGEGG